MNQRGLTYSCLTLDQDIGPVFSRKYLHQQAQFSFHPDDFCLMSAIKHGMNESTVAHAVRYGTCRSLLLPRDCGSTTCMDSSQNLLLRQRHCLELLISKGYSRADQYCQQQFQLMRIITCFVCQRGCLPDYVLAIMREFGLPHRIRRFITPLNVDVTPIYQIVIILVKNVFDKMD